MKNIDFTDFFNVFLSGATITAQAFLWWAIQDLNPGPSGYENVANFERIEPQD